MSDTDSMASYLMKITKLRDQLAAIGVKVEDEELVPVVLNWDFSILETLCPQYLCL
jgi:hypothetical protein